MPFLTPQSGLETNSLQKPREYMHSLAPSWLSQRRRISRTIQTFFWPRIPDDKFWKCLQEKGGNKYIFISCTLNSSLKSWSYFHSRSRELPPFWKLLTSPFGAIWCPTSHGGGLPTVPKVKQHPGKVPEKSLLLQNRCKDVPQLSSKAHFSSGLIIHSLKILIHHS